MSANCKHRWVTVECDGKRDIVECVHCKKRKDVPCKFNGDYS
jgi:hypothetical protein